MVRSAEGGTSLLHKITKPTAWRGGELILKAEEEDARPLARCEEKRKEWAKYSQRYTKVQALNDEPWRNEELKKVEEDMPMLLEKASKNYKAKSGVEYDGFHPKVPLNLTKETRGEVVDFLEKVEQRGRWPQQACTLMFFFLPKNVTSECPVALMPLSLFMQVNNLES